MAKDLKGKGKATNLSTFEILRALYFSGKVKPSLNKILVELENDPENLDLTLLACQCFLRGKDFENLSVYADKAIALDATCAKAYFYKGEAHQHLKGKEQESLKNFDEALALDEENILFLKSKATTHLLLFKDYQLPIKFAEKHRDKGEECILKIISIIEAKETPDYIDYFTLGDVSMTLNRNVDAKMYYIKSVNAFETTKEDERDMNIYKDLIKAQKACIRLLAKFTE